MALFYSLYDMVLCLLAFWTFAQKIEWNDKKYSCENLQTIECINEKMIYIVKLANVFPYLTLWGNCFTSALQHGWLKKITLAPK